MSPGPRWCAFLLTVCFSVSTLAQTPSPDSEKKRGGSPARESTAAAGVNSDAKAGDASALVNIAIEPSRSQSMLGTRLGVMADIRNLSNNPLRFYERETVFMVPPETRIYGSEAMVQGCSSFPTQSAGKAADPRGKEIVIQSGESYRVFWDVGSDSCAGIGTIDQQRYKGDLWGWWKQQWQRILFAPGTYKITLETKFYDTKEDPAKYHTASQSQAVVLSAPQTIILLAAALGGVLAWLVKRNMSVTPPVRPAIEGLSNRVLYYARLSFLEIGGAALLSLVLVILAAALPDSFPIKVNASDFWGTLALGFLANYSGVALLQKLTSSVTGPSPQPGGAPGPATPPPDGEPEPVPRETAPAPLRASPAGAAAMAAGAGAGTAKSTQAEE